MAKYLIDSTDIEIEEVSGTENLKLNLADGNSVEQMIGDLSNLNTTSKSNVVNALNEVNGELTNLNTYSTIETTIGTWIDGKTLYRKVYNFGTLPNTTSVAINSNLNNVKIVKIYGYAVASNNTTIPLPYAAIATNFIVSLNYTSDNKINIETGADRTEYNGYVYIEYTKD